MVNEPHVLVGQFGGPTAVVNASLAGVIETVQELGFGRLLALRHSMQAIYTDDIIDLTSLATQQVDALAHTPGAALGSGRHLFTAADGEMLTALLDRHAVTHLVGIGGNGTMAFLQKVAELTAGRVQVIGAPKTIDNDISHTDHCPGFGSAGRFLALAARDTGLDLEAMSTFDDVTILEAMGRNTGWLAAAAALSKHSTEAAPHLIYVPEHPFSEQQCLAAVSDVHQRLGRVFIVVSEGIRGIDGRFVGENLHPAPKDGQGRPVHSLSPGVAGYLCDLIRGELGLQARFLRPGLIGRALSACVSAVDRAEAREVGRQVVRRLAEGQSGCMVALKRISEKPYAVAYETVPLEKVAGTERPLPGTFFDGAMITNDFRTYANPLCGFTAEEPHPFRLEPSRPPDG